MSLQKSFSIFLISSLAVCSLAFCDEDHEDHEDRARDEISYEERGLQGDFQGRPLRPNAPNPELGPNPARPRPRGYNDNINIQEGPYNEGGYRTRERVQADESQAAESPMQEQRMYNQQQQQNQQQIP